MNGLPDNTTPTLGRGWSTARNLLYALIALPALLTVGFFAAYISWWLSPGSYDSFLNPRVELVVAGVLTVVVLLPWRFLLCRPECDSPFGSLLAEILLVCCFVCLYLGGLLSIQLRPLNISFTDSFRPSSNSWATTRCYSWYCHVEKGGMGSAWATFGLLAVLLALLVTYGVSHPRAWLVPFGGNHIGFEPCCNTAELMQEVEGARFPLSSSSAEQPPATTEVEQLVPLEGRDEEKRLYCDL